ncbi:MAG: NAD-dependent epimerase/dehydratase family protein [Deltaproteobacteria bacterium]|nr:NAD-dependent epimerase/dehydratase family protein [Deltaproteobacteria bacterium]
MGRSNTTILITGGAGSVGRYLTLSLLERGYKVRVFDRDVEPLNFIHNANLTRFHGNLGDRELLRSAVEEVDAVLHLAWSFSNDPLEVFDGDIKDHLYLLEEMASRRVRHLVYASTAVVYGKPRYYPIDEGHPLVVEEARKPLYGIAKAAAEKLCLLYEKEKGIPATIFRFWWAYGEEIGGRHLREMLRTAAEGELLEVPADAGGSFLHLADMVQALDLTLFNPKAYGRTFNFSTIYMTWEEVAEMVREVTGSSSEIRCVPKGEWRGSAFLADPWELSYALSRNLLGFGPMDAAMAKASLKTAISNCWKAMKGG